jgi:hypothetical protein
MKRDYLTTILALTLLASSLAASAMCYKFWRLSQENRGLQSVVGQVNQKRAMVNSFIVELNEYSLRNPAITPLLDQMSFRLRLTTNTIPIAR